MDDDVLDRISALVDEEHDLVRKASSGEPLSEADDMRLARWRSSSRRRWDLLRQRRARRDAGLDPDDAARRGAETVEGYQQ
jgi:Protein of unknown function (DUF2630)